MEVRTNYISSMMNNNRAGMEKQNNVPGKAAQSWHEQLVQQINKAEQQTVSEEAAVSATEEYEQDLYDKIQCIPVGSALKRASVVIRLTDEAIERMSRDSEYEKLVMDQLKSVLGGDGVASGSSYKLIIDVGANIEDFKVESRPMESVSAGKEEKVDYWKQRTERFEEIEEQLHKRLIKKKRIDKQLRQQDMAEQIRVEVIQQQAIQNGDPASVVKMKKGIYLEGVPAEFLLSGL